MADEREDFEHLSGERFRDDPQAAGERIRAAAEREPEEEEPPAAEPDTQAPGEGEGVTTGEPPAEEEVPPQDPDARACETCEGWGIVQTGSKVPDRITRQCSTCQGAGFVERRRAPEGDNVEAIREPEFVAPGAGWG